MSDRVQAIEFIHTKKTSKTFILEDRWEFRPSGRCAWLLRKVFAWACSKGYFVNPSEKVFDYTRQVIYPQSVIEALFEQQAEVMQLIGRDATTVLMGSDDYADLMRTDAAHRYVTFNAEARIGRREVLGLTVKIIPWMRGIVVVPEWSK